MCVLVLRKREKPHRIVYVLACASLRTPVCENRERIAHIKPRAASDAPALMVAVVVVLDGAGGGGILCAPCALGHDCGLFIV